MGTYIKTLFPFIPFQQTVVLSSMLLLGKQDVADYMVA